MPVILQLWRLTCAECEIELLPSLHIYDISGITDGDIHLVFTTLHAGYQCTSGRYKLGCYDKDGHGQSLQLSSSTDRGYYYKIQF